MDLENWNADWAWFLLVLTLCVGMLWPAAPQREIHFVPLRKMLAAERQLLVFPRRGWGQGV